MGHQLVSWNHNTVKLINTHFIDILISQTANETQHVSHKVMEWWFGHWQSLIPHWDNKILKWRELCTLAQSPRFRLSPTRDQWLKLHQSKTFNGGSRQSKHGDGTSLGRCQSQGTSSWNTSSIPFMNQFNQIRSVKNYTCNIVTLHGEMSHLNRME